MTVLRDNMKKEVPYGSYKRYCVWTSGERGGVGACGGLCVGARETWIYLLFSRGGRGGKSGELSVAVEYCVLCVEQEQAAQCRPVLLVFVDAWGRV